MARVLPAPILSVTGGVAGVAADWAVTAALAAELDATADTVRARSGRSAAVILDVELLASGAWSPVTFARAERAVTAAVTGTLACSGRFEIDAAAVRAAVAGLRCADALAHEALEVRDYALGRVVGEIALPALVLAAPRAVATWWALPPDVRGRLTSRLGPVLSTTAQQVMVAHPGVVQTAVNASGGLIDGLAHSPVQRLGTQQAADTLAGLYDDGRARVVERTDVAPPAGSTLQPHTVTGLLGALAGVARLSATPTSPLNGTIAVTTLHDGAGARHIVYLPGTDDLATTPWSQDHDVRDMGTNLDLIAGRPTSYGAGVLEAMRHAGIGSDEPVLLVGHSQGGMQAAALAASDPPYRISDVVTAGSPLAQVDVPEHVGVLALENRGDIVPLTDGEPNRGTTSHVTVQVDAGGEGVVGHHDYDRYAAAASAVDASDDPSLEAAARRLRDGGFLAGGGGDGQDGGGGGGGPVEVRTRIFQVTRR